MDGRPYSFVNGKGLNRCRNLALSLAAGNATIWKPSPSTPLCSIAVTQIIARVLESNGIPGAVAGLVTGGKDTGEAIAESRDIELGILCSTDQSLQILIMPCEVS